MREALAGLTVRGRAFLAAGLTAVVCGVVLGQPALHRVGVLLLALPLVTLAVLGRTRYRLSLARTVAPQQVPAGQPGTVSLRLTNEGRTPSGVLLLEDQLPFVLGTRPRFVLEGIGHGWSRHATYRVRSDLRGRYQIGPMSVRVRDPFGLVELGRTFRTTATLTVTPRTVALAPISLGPGWSGSGEDRVRASTAGSAEDVTVREYRRGDDLRRVHWRSSARTGELMVRREEQPWQSRATILLDNRIGAHRGSGPASSFETAVVAAASAAEHLARRGYRVRLVTAAGEDPATSWAGGDAAPDARPVLDTLAGITLARAARLEPNWVGAQSTGGVVVALVGNLDGRDAELLRRVRHHTGLALALALDVAAWTTRPAEEATHSAVPVLAHQGWRVRSLGPADALASAWEALRHAGPPGAVTGSAAAGHEADRPKGRGAIIR